MFIKQQETFECPKYNFKLEKKTLDARHKTLYVVSFIKASNKCSCLFMCNTSRTTSSNSEFLAGESHEISEILMTSE